MSASRTPRTSREGPCLRCTISAIVALLIGVWMTLALVRSIGAIGRRLRH